MDIRIATKHNLSSSLCRVWVAFNTTSCTIELEPLLRLFYCCFAYCTFSATERYILRTWMSFRVFGGWKLVTKCDYVQHGRRSHDVRVYIYIFSRYILVAFRAH